MTNKVSIMLRHAFRILMTGVMAAYLITPALTADVTNPAEVQGLTVDRDGDDILLSWAAVTEDASGNPETISSYNIYRGDTPDFIPDKDFGSNMVGDSATTDFRHTGAAVDGIDHYYLVSAVDTPGNEGLTRGASVHTAPVLSGYWTETTIEIDWTDAQPVSDVAGYRVYYGKGAGEYEFVDDVGLGTSHTLSGLDLWVNWYIVVTAVDLGGNESAFSNEHIDAVAGRVRVRAHDDSELCWGAAKCPPEPGHVQRSDGWQLMVPADFPEGDWRRVLVSFTIDSKLCEPPAQENVTKCGSGNPCLHPPCNGGYNTCGDPWDRGAHLFLVEDDCIEGGGSCITDANPELMNAVTPFGTDAEPPDGTGVVPPRVLTLDITPYAPILTGTKYVGAHIGHYVQSGWWVTVDFEFSERPDETSPKPPADGLQQVFNRGGGEILDPATVTIPADASKVIGRFFVTGHGGNQRCDGGSEDGNSCDTGCPGGSCQNCDEFCHREHKVMIDGTEAWVVTPWRDDCTPGSIFACQDWNACGWPSCTYSRAGWCPGYIACHHDAPCDQDIDLSAYLTPGASHEVTWLIPILNGSWSKSLMVYWYEPGTPFCGNGVIDGDEVCDFPDLDGETCQSQGYDAGDLQCGSSCQAYDTSGCWNYACPNSICEIVAGEDCVTCPEDCNAVLGGSPSGRYCCGGGDYPVGCEDPRCTGGGNTCYE